MIQISSLSKFFAKFQAVNDISFNAKEGEIIGFLVPNGTGKTKMRLV